MYPHTRVLDSKIVEGHGTEAMAPPMRQERAIWSRSKDSHDCREAPLSWASELIPQSIEEIFQLKGVDVSVPNNRYPVRYPLMTREPL